MRRKCEERGRLRTEQGRQGRRLADDELFLHGVGLVYGVFDIAIVKHARFLYQLLPDGRR